MSTAVHGDDFFSEGPADNLQKIKDGLEKEFHVKMEGVGPGPGQVFEARVLNRIIRWEDTGVPWEPDFRNAEIMIEQMGSKGAKGVMIQGVNEEKKGENELRADIDNVIESRRTTTARKRKLQR